MQEFDLVWDANASKDIENIWEYISLDSKGAARKVVNNIRDCSKSLKLNPYIGQEEELLKKFRLGHRYLVYSHYKIIYRVIEDKVFVIAIFDTRQNPLKLKKIIKRHQQG